MEKTDKRIADAMLEISDATMDLENVSSIIQLLSHADKDTCIEDINTTAYFAFTVLFNSIETINKAVNTSQAIIREQEGIVLPCDRNASVTEVGVAQ